MTDDKGEEWIKAGFAELARSGVEGVRVEVLAKNLGVTKGGFYRRFRDRAALLDGMLQAWSAGRIAAREMHPPILSSYSKTPHPSQSRLIPTHRLRALLNGLRHVLDQTVTRE